MKVKHLAIGVGVLLVLAVVGVMVQRLAGRSSSEGRVGEPVLASIDMSKAAAVELTGPANRTTLTATPDGWVVQEQGGFPADQGKLGSFLFKLNNEKLAYKVTDNPEKLVDLGLLLAEENNGKLEEHKTGILFSIKGADGKPMFQLVVGKDRQPTATASAYGGQYVRFPAEKAAYLIGITLIAETDSKEWIQKAILPPDSNKQFQRISVVRQEKAKPLVFSRDKADSPWELDGATVRNLNTKEIDNLAKRLSDLEAVQVAKPDAQPVALGRGKLAFVGVVTFDGRTYRYEIGDNKAADSYRYVTVQADLAANATDESLKKSVADFNARYQKRIMAVYDWDATRLLKDRKDYIEVVKPPVTEEHTRESKRARD